ncbi:hypothetical protein [Bradyrhizobium prioriisuperbiae]|uniref:hypothetical protein n=1 Tax=Bradyrhizobium prioriisuperbiae TaxID=2854389 RepID=UPI0028E6647E|nr:hypothetical protein [Bradyrhizobium prioritasuperba]
MTRSSHNEFDSEFVSTLRAVLDEAVKRISQENRTPATKAKMAERIVRSAAAGVTDAGDLISEAVEEGRVPAA